MSCVSLQSLYSLGFSFLNFFSSVDQLIILVFYHFIIKYTIILCMHLVRNIFTFITKPIVLLHLILVIQWGLFLGTTFHPYTLNVPNRTYLMLRGHLLYTSFIRQAKEGAWSLYNPHTTRPTPKAYAHLFFVALGKISAIFTIDPPVMYMMSRMIAAVILFWCTYWFIGLVLPPSLHALAIFFVLALEPGPLMNLKPAIFSYYPQIVAYRHFGLPHHTMGEAIGLLLLGACILCVQKPTLKRLLSLGVLGLISTTILPPYPVIIILTVLAPWAIYSIFTGTTKRLFLPFGIVAIAVGAVALFMKHEFAKGYPWKDFNLDEKRWVTNSDVLINYTASLLLSFPFVLYLWGSITRKWNSFDRDLKLTILLMTSWVIVPVFLVPISPATWFPFANFRLMDGYNYVPMGILATLGLSLFVKRFSKKFVLPIILATLLLISGSLTTLYTTQTLEEQKGLWSNVYLGNGHWQAFAFLNTVPKQSGIMVMNHFGEIIPDFASVRTFIGSTPGFVNWSELFHIATRFYTGQLTDTEAEGILQKEDISYVYYSDGEKYYNITSTLYPNLLTSVFETPGIIIYQVNSRRN